MTFASAVSSLFTPSNLQTVKCDLTAHSFGILSVIPDAPASTSKVSQRSSCSAGICFPELSALQWAIKNFLAGSMSEEPHFSGDPAPNGRARRHRAPRKTLDKPCWLSPSSLSTDQTFLSNHISTWLMLWSYSYSKVFMEIQNRIWRAILTSGDLGLLGVVVTWVWNLPLPPHTLH